MATFGCRKLSVEWTRWTLEISNHSCLDVGHPRDYYGLCLCPICTDSDPGKLTSKKKAPSNIHFWFGGQTHWRTRELTPIGGIMVGVGSPAFDSSLVWLLQGLYQTRSTPSMLMAGCLGHGHPATRSPPTKHCFSFPSCQNPSDTTSPRLFEPHLPVQCTR